MHPMSAQEMKEYTEKIGEFSTHYHEIGEGEEVLLIHGSGLGVSALANWRQLMPLLGREFHVFALDLVGFGQSEKPRIEYSKEVWLRHIIRFIEAKMKPPVHIVGNSLGGGLALNLAAKRPDLVGKLVLMGTMGFHFELTEGLDLAWGSQPGMENVRRLIRHFAYNQSMADDDELVRIRHEASSAPGLAEIFASMFPEPRQRHIDSMALSEEEVRKIEHPTLLLHGRDDRVIPIEVSWKLAHLMPNAQLHTFPKCGHWIQIEQAVPFYKQVKTFLETN
jgi:2-hydroxymuconate-semialdehyde hydrolase